MRVQTTQAPDWIQELLSQPPSPNHNKNSGQSPFAVSSHFGHAWEVRPALRDLNSLSKKKKPFHSLLVCVGVWHHISTSELNLGWGSLLLFQGDCNHVKCQMCQLWVSLFHRYLSEASDKDSSVSKIGITGFTWWWWEQLTCKHKKCCRVRDIATCNKFYFFKKMFLRHNSHRTLCRFTIIHCKMITTVVLAHTSIISHNHFFFL